MPAPALAALIDLDDAATIVGMPADVARSYLESLGEVPVATYHGRPLWLSDSVHDSISPGATA